MKPRVLSIAGSDSSGGAGIQADLKTMFAHGVHGMSVVTTLTAQNSLGVQSTWPVPVDFVIAQLHSVLDDIGVDAIKIGALGNAAVVKAVAGQLPEGVPLVVDPVLLSTHGQPLLDEAGAQVMRDELLPLSTIITPNLAEAGSLTGMRVTTEADMVGAARTLLGLGPRWVLVTGGHLAGEAADLLTDGSTSQWLRGPRLPSRHTHGSGCSLASAIASRLALGDDVVTAVTGAKRWISGAIAAGFALGAGIGPVDQGWDLARKASDAPGAVGQDS